MHIKVCSIMLEGLMHRSQQDYTSPVSPWLETASSLLSESGAGGFLDLRVCLFACTLLRVDNSAGFDRLLGLPDLFWLELDGYFEDFLSVLLPALEAFLPAARSGSAIESVKAGSGSFSLLPLGGCKRSLFTSCNTSTCCQLHSLYKHSMML